MLKSRGFWIGIGLTSLLAGWFVWRNWDKFPDMKRAFTEADWRLALLSLPIYFAGLFVRTVRWQYLLRPVKRVSPLRLYPVVIIGLMANNVLPARAGSSAEGICSKTMSGVTWSALISVICSSWWDDAVRHRFTHDIGLGENHRSGG